jgi:hypothetical protein
MLRLAKAIILNTNDMDLEKKDYFCSKIQFANTKKKIMNRVRKFLLTTGTFKGIYLLLLIFCSQLVYGQSALNILDFYHETFPAVKARIITAKATVGNYTFHANAGGISFQAVASPADNLKNRSVSVDFTNNRLVVQIGTQNFYPDLPLWQLTPIASFADSPYTVVVTQMGDTIGKKEAECLFHPAFLDNLLGLRLFQAELLNIPDILWDIPIDAQRKPILATSEQPFTPQMDSAIHRTIYEKLTGSEKFTSFTLTDKDVDMVFEINGSELKLSGNPYYYFTKTEVDTANVRQLRMQLDECYKVIETHAEILLKEKYSPDLNPRTNLKGLIKTLSENKQERIFNPYSTQYVEKSLKKLETLNQMTDDQIGIKFKTLDSFSESFKPYWSLLKKYNPLVYSAVENTAQWAAFFRYVKTVNPENWALFVKKIQNNKSDAPAVRTPTSSEINYFRLFDELNR